MHGKLKISYSMLVQFIIEKCFPLTVKILFAVLVDVTMQTCAICGIIINKMDRDCIGLSQHKVRLKLCIKWRTFGI
jgi:hypothetical protein